MPRMLGDAFIVISPLTDKFGAEAQAQIKAQLAGIHPQVKVDADTSAIPAAITALMQRLKQLSQGRVAFADLIDINVPQGQIVTQLLLLKRLIQHAGLSDMLGINLNDAQIREQLQKIASLSATVEVGANTGSAEQAIALLQGQLAGLELRLSRLTVNLNDTDAMAKIGELEQMASALYDQLDHLTADVDVTEVLTKIYDVEAEIKALNSDAGVVRIQADIAGVTAAIAAVETKLAGLKSVSENINIGANVGQAVASLAALAGAEKAAGAGAQESAAQLLAQAAAAGNAADAAKLAYAAQVAQTIAMGGVAKATAGANAQVKAGIPLWTQGAGIFGAWNGKITLFGGALKAVPLLASIGAFHALAETILEFAATLIPATIAITAWGAAAASTFEDVYKRATSLYTAQQALQQAFSLTFTNVANGVTVTRNLASAFGSLEAQVRPQVYTLLGEGLYILTLRAGALNPVILASGKVIDDLGARFAYAVTTGNAFSVFIKNAANDLAGWGNLIGNIGGIIGGILKQLPGYGEIFLSVLENITHAIEIFVNSGFGQALLGIGLAAHGAIIWIGLLSTAFTFLATRALAGLSSLLLSLGVALDRLGASAAAGLLANFGRSLGIIAADAGPVIGAVGLVAAGIGFLVYQLINAKSQAQQFADALQKSIGQSALTNLSQTLTQQLATMTIGLSEAQKQLASFGKYTIEAADSELSFGARGGGMSAAAQKIRSAVQGAQQSVADYSAGLKVVQGDQDTLNQHISQAAGIFGSTSAAWAVLNGAGITSNQILSKSAQTWGEALIEAQAYNAVLRQVFDSTGRYAAAQNALNYTADDTANKLGLLDADITKVVQSQTQLLAVVTGGSSALDTFEQGIYTLGQNFNQAAGSSATVNTRLGTLSATAKLAGQTISGTSAAAYALNAAFYQQISSAQAVIGALETQDIGTKNLTTATATMAAQMVSFAGNNTAARVAVVALINNALGPGTVSLQNLNTWVKNNSTTMQGFNAIVAQAQIKAASLAGVLQQDLTAQFRADLLATSGADAALKTYTSDITHNQTATAAGVADRARLIKDLENSGLSAQQATTFVNGLSTSINNIPKNTAIVLRETGTGLFTITGSVVSASQGPGGSGNAAGGLAAGGLIKMGSGPTADDVLVRVSKGETVVSAADSRLLAPAFSALGIPGYAAGGSIGALAGQTTAWHTSFDNAVTAAMERAMTAAMKGAISAATAAVAAAAAGGGGAVANSGTIASLAAAHGWTGAQLTALLNVIARESGGSTTATNPTSGAYGIAQFIGGPSEYAVYGGNSTTVAGQVTAMLNYISQRYGTPAAAWQHELQYGWYDNGGLLKPGATLAWNGTGRNEYITTGHGGTDQGINIVNELRRQNYYMQQLIQTVTSVPVATGQHVGAAINGAAGQANWNHRYQSRGW